jgi:hypothetical protein
VRVANSFWRDSLLERLEHESGFLSHTYLLVKSVVARTGRRGKVNVDAHRYRSRGTRRRVSRAGAGALHFMCPLRQQNQNWRHE